MSKRQNIYTEEKYDLMFKQLIAYNKGNGGAYTNKTQFLEKWIREEWLNSDCSNYKLIYEGNTYHFVTKEGMERAQQLIETYISKGLEMDHQLMSFVLANNNGFTLN